MALLPIIVAPDPRLKVKCQEVRELTNDIKILADDMLETMYDAPGIGLAAPQVGVTKRIIVVDISRPDEPNQAYTMVNPVVSWFSEELIDFEEGCLSLPEHYVSVRRPGRIQVSYLDIEGSTKILEASGILATCIQHEVDHLDGKLFVDYTSKLRRDSILRKLKKYKLNLAS